MKVFEKVKKVGNRCKAVVMAAAVAVVGAGSSVCASAATVEASGNMETMMKSAGDQLTEQFSSLVGTIVPVIIGILGVGLVIFGIIKLVGLAKKVFGKVAG